MPLAPPKEALRSMTPAGVCVAAATAGVTPGTVASRLVLMVSANVGHVSKAHMDHMLTLPLPHGSVSRGTCMVFVITYYI